MLRKLEEKIKFRYIFKRLLPLEKSPIKSNWLATVLINDTAEDLEKEKERIKWENTIQYLLETGVELAQTLIKDILEDCEHESATEIQALQAEQDGLREIFDSSEDEDEAFA